MKLISFLAQHSRSLAAFAILAGVVSGACGTALLAAINDAFSHPGAAPRGLLWLFFALCVLLPLSRFFSEWLLVRLGQDTLLELRLKLVRQVLSVPLRRLEELGPHRLLAALTDDIPTITNALLFIPLVCINVAVVAAGLVYLGWLSPLVLLAVLGVMAVGIVGYQLPVNRALVYLRRARELTDKLHGHFRAVTDGTKELKLHRRRSDAFLADELQPTAAEFRRQNIKGMTVYTAAAAWGQALGFVVVGLLVLVLPTFYPTDANVITGYALVLLYILTPLQLVMNTLPAISRANIAVGNVEQLGLSLTSAASGEKAAAPEAAGASWRSVELLGVQHAYRREQEEDSFVLGPIDLTLRPGEVVFLVGGNGSGKTTLAKLLLGLYVPEAGEVRLDGWPVTDDNRDAYRQLFSAVFSDYYLFESLLGIDAQNLDEEARRYLSQLQLEHKVRVDGGKLSTTSLSQGQRKRLALLTAYLEDRPIYLFDEWAADQDPVFKRIFYLQLLPSLRARGKTVLVISHDDQYYHVGDRVIKLDYGKIEFEQTAVNPRPARAMAETHAD
jgi:putative ATP-binding cassette transporter